MANSGRPRRRAARLKVEKAADYSYVWSAVRHGGAKPPPQSEFHAPAAKSNGNGTGKTKGPRRQTPSSNLSNASKAGVQRDESADARGRAVEAALKAQRELLLETKFPQMSAKAQRKFMRAPPASAPAGQAPKLPLSIPNSSKAVWDKTHEVPGVGDGKGNKPMMDRSDCEFEGPDEGLLCLDAFEQAEKEGRKEVNVELVRRVVDYFEDRVEELAILACDDRGKIGEVVKMVEERIEMVERRSGVYHQILGLKTSEEGWRGKLDVGVQVLEVEELRSDVEILGGENREMLHNYAVLEKEFVTNKELWDFDKEIISHFEESDKRKDEHINGLEDELERKEKEIALAGFESRPKLRNSISGTLETDNQSHVSHRSDDNGLASSDSDDKTHTSTISNTSTDTSVSSATANIHIIEMSMLHSKKQYNLASAAGAKAEKYASADSDPKTLIAVKAWRGSTLALNDGKDSDIEDAKRLFEDALFLAQGRKGKKRNEGEIWEDKCHAWLLHLADMEVKRAAPAAASREIFQEPGKIAKGKETKTKPSSFSKGILKCPPQCALPASAGLNGEGLPAMLEHAISLSAAHNDASAPPTTINALGSLSNEVEAAHFYSDSTAPSQRSISPADTD